MEEGEGDERGVEVGGGAKGISGEDTESTGVGGHAGVDGDFHGEVGNDSGVGQGLIRRGFKGSDFGHGLRSPGL
jgi:hypothetical protein